MYDTLLRDKAQKKYQATMEPASPQTPVYTGHFAPPSTIQQSSDSSLRPRRDNSCPNRKSTNLAQAEPEFTVTFNGPRRTPRRRLMENQMLQGQAHFSDIAKSLFIDNHQEMY